MFALPGAQTYVCTWEVQTCLRSQSANTCLRSPERKHVHLPRSANTCLRSPERKHVGAFQMCKHVFALWKRKHVCTFGAQTYVCTPGMRQHVCALGSANICLRSRERKHVCAFEAQTCVCDFEAQTVFALQGAQTCLRFQSANMCLRSLSSMYACWRLAQTCWTRGGGVAQHTRRHPETLRESLGSRLTAPGRPSGPPKFQRHMNPGSGCMHITNDTLWWHRLYGGGRFRHGAPPHPVAGGRC